MVLDAMQQFAQAQDKWYPTWPVSDDDRALRMYALFLFKLHVHRSDTRTQRLREDVGAVLRTPPCSVFSAFSHGTILNSDYYIRSFSTDRRLVFFLFSCCLFHAGFFLG